MCPELGQPYTCHFHSFIYSIHHLHMILIAFLNENCWQDGERPRVCLYKFHFNAVKYSKPDLTDNIFLHASNI